MPTQISAETRIYKMWLFGIFQIKKKTFNSKHFEIIKFWYIWANFLVLKPNIFRFSTKYFCFLDFHLESNFVILSIGVCYDIPSDSLHLCIPYRQNIFSNSHVYYSKITFCINHTNLSKITIEYFVRYSPSSHSLQV